MCLYFLFLLLCIILTLPPPNKIKAYCIFLSVFAEVCVFLSVYYIYNLSKFIISSSFFQR